METSHNGGPVLVLYREDDTPMSITEVMLYLGITRHAARRLVKSGALGETTNVGAHTREELRVRYGAVKAYAAERPDA